MVAESNSAATSLELASKWPELGRRFRGGAEVWVGSLPENAFKRDLWRIRLGSSPARTLGIGFRVGLIVVSLVFVWTQDTKTEDLAV